MNQPDAAEGLRGSECPSREVLSGLALGRLPAKTFDAVAEHLAGCTACQAALDTLDDSADHLVRGLRGTPDVDSVALPAELQRQIALAERIVEREWMTKRGEETEAGPKPGSQGSGVVEPQSFGQYQLLEQIGAGGMGTVWKARHLRLRRHVAIKFLPKDRARDPQAIARFEREMAAVGVLDHPHLVRAHDAGEIEGQPFLVMEYVQGMDLSTLVSRLGRLPIAEACEVIRQAALGLQYAHEHGLVHRDIKPSNLMLAVSGQLSAFSNQPSALSNQRENESEKLIAESCKLKATIKILDLGLALLEIPEAAHGELTSSGQAMGTADYISPEQAADSHSVDIRADIYSLGCTLYKLLTGQSPFAGPKYKTAMQKMVGHLSGDAPSIQGLRPEVPNELAAIVHRMLAKSPEDRPATPAEVAGVLEAFSQKADLRRLYAEAIDDRNAPTADPAQTGTQPHLSSALTDTESRSRPAGEVEIGPGAAQSPAQPKAATRRYLPWLGGAIALALLGGGLYFGITILLKDDKNQVVAEITVPDATTAEIVPHKGTSIEQVAKPLARPDQASPSRGPVQDVLPGLVPRPAQLPGIGRWQIETVLPRQPIQHLQWSPDGRFVACSTGDAVRFYRTGDDYGLVRLLPAGIHGANPRFSPDGKWVALVPTNVVQLWDLETNRPGLRFPRQGNDDSLDADWSPDSRRLVLANRSRLGVWTVDGVLQKDWDTGWEQVAVVCWSPDGKWIAASHNFGKQEIAIWTPEGKPGPELEAPARARHIGWSPDGQWFAAGPVNDADAQNVRIWSTKTWKKLPRTVPMQLGGNQGLHWSPDSRYLNYAHYCWNLEDDTERRLPYGGIRTWSPDGKRMIIGNLSTIRFWDFAGDNPGPALRGLIDDPEDMVIKWQRSPDGQWLATLSDKDRIQIWTADGRPAHIATNGHALAWSPNASPQAWQAGDGWAGVSSPDGRFHAKANYGQVIEVHDTGKDQQVAVLHGHVGWGGNLRLVWTSNEHLISVLGDDQTLRYWHVPSGECLSVSAILPDGQAAYISHDGKLQTTSPEAEKHLIYVVEQPDGELKLFTPAEFRELQKRAAGVLSNASESTVAAWPLGPAEDVLPGIIPRAAKIPGIHRWQLATLHRAGPASALMAWSPDSRLIACGDDNAVRILDADSLQTVRILIGVDALVQAVAWCGAGDFLASGHRDGWLFIWRRDGTVAQTAKLPVGIVGLAASPDGEQLFVDAADDQPSRVVNLEGQLEYVLDGWTGLGMWSPDGSWLAGMSGSSIAVRHADGRPGVVIEGPAQAGNIRLAWHPQGQWLACAAGDGKIRLFKPDGTAGPTISEGSNETALISWSRDGEWIASASRGTRLWKADGSPGPVLGNDLGEVVWSPDGRHFAAVGAGRVRIWRIQPQFLEIYKTVAAANYQCLAWSPDGKRFGYATDRDAGWVGLDGSSKLMPCQFAAGLCASEWSQDGTTLACSSPETGMVTLWSADGTLRALKRYPMSAPRELDIAWHRDGKRLAVGAGDGVSVWDTAKPEAHPDTKCVRKEYPVVCGDQPNWVAWSPDGKYLVSCGDVDAANFDRRFVRLWKEDGTPIKTVECHAVGVAWSPDGTVFATLSMVGESGEIRFWSPDGTLRSSIKAGAGGITFSPDGQRIAAIVGWETRIWTRRGKEGPRLPGSISGCHMRPAWSPDGRLIASRAVNTGIGIWNAEGAPQSILKSLSFDVRGLSWSRDGRRLASASGNGVLQLWDIQSGLPQWEAVLLADGTWATFSSSGQIRFGDPEKLKNQLVYVVQRRHDAPQELWTFQQFQEHVAKEGMNLR